MRIKHVALTVGTAALVALALPTQAQALGTAKGTCLGAAHPYGPYGESTSSYARTYAYPNQACPSYTVKVQYGAGGGGPTYWTGWYVGGSGDLSVRVDRSSVLGAAHGGYGSTASYVFYT
ncbi:hypothetical protein [Kitasatospora phosalacinea]|uniref:Uncharacterized protein n=1 Tax=Kitasatospora phosalacinea TaxID=2065 RepID=A0ABW6GLB1_9ACTN